MKGMESGVSNLNAFSFVFLYLLSDLIKLCGVLVTIEVETSYSRVLTIEL